MNRNHTTTYTKFCHCTTYRTLANSQTEQLCKWAIYHAHLVTTDHMGNAHAYHYLPTKFYENLSLRSIKGSPFCWWAIHPYIHTYIYRHRDKENLSGPSSIADGPQKKEKKSHHKIWMVVVHYHPVIRFIIGRYLKYTFFD